MEHTTDNSARGLQLPEHYEQDLVRFFAPRPGSFALYEALVERLKHELSPLTVKVQKTQISFYHKHLFAMVSLPRRKAEQGIVVSFGSWHKVDSPRIAYASEPYPNRWTHHLPVTDAAQLDAELFGWLHEAYDFAAGK